MIITIIIVLIIGTISLSNTISLISGHVDIEIF